MPHTDAPAEWARTVLADLRMACGRVERLSSLGDPFSCWHEWQAFIVREPHAWRAAVREVRMLPAASPIEVGEGPENSFALVPPAIPCPECARLFSCKKAVATHRYRVHGHRKAVVAHLARGVRQCPHCDKVFPSHAALLDHAEYRSKSCKAAILALPLAPPPEWAQAP